ncbi:MAG: NAD(P)H-dependent glycerol-3-phosphate dehydrogenase [Bdellovibrionota bacterium]
MSDQPKIAVIGAGAWGTAIAHLLSNKPLPVTFWARESEVIESITKERENKLFFPGFKLPANLKATGDLSEAAKGAKIVVFVVPSQFLRSVAKQAAPHFEKNTVVVCASKGIEKGTLALMSEVLLEELPEELHGALCALSGPSFAKEVAQEMPTNVTLACENRRVAKYVQEIFHRPFFRVYTSYDIVGVELGGSLKNVIAIAAGALEGMGLGYNTQAALMTRGLAEISRLGARLGANPLTFAGLSGMGDLVLTCTGALSRNRTVGIRIGKGEKVADILKDMRQVAEGVETSKSAFQLAQREKVEMPIVEQIYRVVHEGKDLKQALHDILSRELKSELE